MRRYPHGLIPLVAALLLGAGVLLPPWRGPAHAEEKPAREAAAQPPSPAGGATPPGPATPGGGGGDFDKGVAAMQGGDYVHAAELWGQAAAAGDARAQYSMGYLAEFGLGMAADAQKARDFYQKAAEQKNADAVYALGLLAESGKAGGRDLAEAMRYYRQAVALGPHADAEYAIGRMILRGRGVPRDPIEGVSWLKKAADHGHPAAQYMLGAAYEAGWGVTPDPVQAYVWYRRAQQGDAEELKEQDLSFQPKIALDSLKRHMSAEQIRKAEAMVKPAAEKPKAKKKDHGKI